MSECRLDITLFTKNLLLRPLNTDDVSILWPDMSDSEISKYMAWETHTDKTQTVEFLKNEVKRRETGRGVTWGIFKEGTFCGIFSLIGITIEHRALTYNKGELAYWLGRRWQGKGIMTEAGNRVVQYSFQDLKLHKLCVSHFSVNTASENLIKRLGFRYVGEQIEEFQKNGVWHNHKIYELLDWEYQSQSKNGVNGHG